MTQAELKAHGFLMLALTAIIGITALLVVILLFRSWARFNKRYRSHSGEPPAAEAEKPDPWSVAGQRAEPVETDDDDEEDEDEDEPKRR